LFGYEKGAFTGAHKTKQGRFESANKGTIFLDEIGDMPLELQSKLLQAIEQQEFVRVGGVHNIRVDVRIVSATNKNLEEAIAQKKFRDDLFYRLNEITLGLPPLRQRRGDIPLLVNHFIERYNKMYKKTLPDLSAETMNRLVEHEWSGNVRQLENFIKQMVVRNDESIVNDLLATAPRGIVGGEIQSYETNGSFPGAVTNGAPEGYSDSFDPETDGYSLKARIDKVVSREESQLIRAALSKTNWNRRKASQLLDISYRSLLYKIKEYSLNEIK